MSDNQKALKRFQEWEHYALEDEQTIEIIIKEDGPPNQICLHSQQMAEKYLKGYLAYKKHFLLKSHFLDQLLDECKKYDESFSEIAPEALNLSDYYIEARYPGDIVEFSLEEAKEAYRKAKNIKEFVLSKIN